MAIKSSSSTAVSPQKTDREEQVSENILRPQTLDQYVGQSQIKSNLRVFCKAAKQRKEPLEHVLLSGPPGLGKTTLAYIIAREMEAPLRMTAGPVIEKAADLAAILTSLQAGEVLFIDEIHRLRPAIEEILYSAMEDFRLDIILGKGPGARTMRLDLPKFTVIGATTKAASLSAPLRDRFGHNFRLEFYAEEEIAEIISRSAKILEIELDESAKRVLAARSRRTPRIANRLLRRTRDFASVDGQSKVSKSAAESALKALGIDEVGLNIGDRALLETLCNKFNGGPVGLNTLSAALAEEEATIEDVYEPFLLQLGFIERTSRGRKATPRAWEHLGMKAPAENAKLF
ncbi:MAG: Holliday junction branch migration DNA helicase RuvB [Patescibacteria group bacterium]|nr:Holliday junction branch migration DNA helicase RuvB [Patescibacteria group bacterium]